VDDHGNPYFADHNTKTTTWYDPRQPVPDASMRSRQGFNEEQSYYPHGQSQSQQSQHFLPAPSDYNASTYQRVQQLENERNTLQERQEQLLRSGLLDSSPAQYGNAQSPLQQSSSFNMRTHDYPYGSMPTPNQPQSHMMSYSCENEHPSRMNPGIVDSGMDIDYPSTMNTIEPSFTISDINPHEFDKYLHLSDNRPSTSESQQMIPRYP
ncbi:unnamed protein product, partial [Auanema sp. JU1783]